MKDVTVINKSTVNGKRARSVNPFIPYFNTYVLPTFEEKCMSDVVRIVIIIIFHLSELWRAKFFILCVM